MGTKRKQEDLGDEKNNKISPPPMSEEDSACVVRSTRDEKPLHYTLKVQSFSLLKTAFAKPKPHERYVSQIFVAGGYKWKLALYPNGDEKRNASDHISLYLVSADDAILSTNSEVNVVFTFLVYDNLRDKYLAVRDGKVRRFHALKTEWGFEKLISLDNFNHPSNGFLVDDCCAFGVDIIVMKYDGKGEVLSLIKEPNNNTYTWKIKNFSKQYQTSIESNPFNVEGYRWKMWLYPKGCHKSTGFLSLYLLLDSSKELSQGSQVYVEYEMTVLSQLGVGHTKSAYYNWFSSERQAYGSPCFMSLRNLKEPTKGFIYNDTLIVEAKINVVSTLKKFLP